MKMCAASPLQLEVEENIITMGIGCCTLFFALTRVYFSKWLCHGVGCYNSSLVVRDNVGVRYVLLV